MPDHYHESIRISDETLVNNLLDLDVDEEIAERRDRITDQIEEVKQELERRETIHEENERDLQSQLVRQNELIQKVGADIEPDSEMRDRKQELQEELRRERKEAFQDVKELNRELRELRKQREKFSAPFS